MNIVSGASGSGISTLEFNAFANTHPSDRTATITVTAGSASGTYVATELGSPDALADREVRALYQKILNREPDSGGFAFWVGVATENPDGLGMMVDNFLTTPPAYEAMNRDFMVLAIYQAILGTPGGAVSPVSYSDWSDAVNQFLSFPQLCADRFCGWQVAGSGLVQTLLSSSTVTNELNSVVVPVCPGKSPSSAASLATMLYENTFGAPPSCTKLNTLITNMVGNGYNGTDPNAAVFNFLLDNIWQPEPFSAPPVWPTSLSLGYQIGNLDSVAPVPISINASGNWTAYTTTGWLSVTPSGVGPGTATVSVYPAVSSGTYTGAVYFNTSGGAQTVSASLLISNGEPVIYTDSPFILAADCCVAQQPIQVLASDGSHVPYTISTSTPGIDIAGETGVTPGSFTASANGNFLDHGFSYGSISITSPGMANSPQTIPIMLEVATSTHAFTYPAFLKTTNGLFTDLLYFTILGRDPDPGGFNFWLNVANSGGPGVYFLPTTGTPPMVRLQMEGSGVPNQGFVGSPEFLGLFK